MQKRGNKSRFHRLFKPNRQGGRSSGLRAGQEHLPRDPALPDQGYPDKHDEDPASRGKEILQGADIGSLQGGHAEDQMMDLSTSDQMNHG